MSRREDIDNVIWSDPDFAELTPQAKLLYLWSFTNQRCGMAGLYKVSRSAMHMECLLPMDQIDAALKELESERFAFYDGRVMWVRSRVKHLRTRTPNIAKSIRDDLERVGVNHPHVQAFVAEYAHLGWLQLEALENLHRPPAEVHPTFERGSTEGHATGGGTSPDVPGQGQGQGSRGGGAGGGVTFDRRPVPKQRVQAAERLLHSFNARAGTDYGAYTGDGKPSESLRRIIGALTRHPNVSAEQWEAAIRWRFEHAFWDGVPDTGVVFGPKVDSANLASSMQEPRRQADLTAKLVGS